MIKSLFKKLFYFGLQSPSAIDKDMKKIRAIEWQSIVGHIPSDSTFLDIGCGAGFSMKNAQKDRNCIVFGVDPNPYGHGVDRQWTHEKDLKNNSLNIQKAFGESLPFNDQMFDVVYSSHVLEHVTDQTKTLQEAKRVLKDHGVLILGVPTASMAWVNLISQTIFTTHHRLLRWILFKLKINTQRPIHFKNVWMPYSHSFYGKTVWYDIHYYKMKHWQSIISKEFDIQEVILPALYPFPDFIPYFPIIQNNKISSSVFFVARKIV